MDDQQTTAPERGEQPLDQSLIPQLFAVLTARSRDERGRLAVGAPKRRLLEALRIRDAELEELLERVAAKTRELGLELGEYRRGGDTWLCLTSVHGGPTELTEVEQGVLGLLIHLVLKAGRRRCALMEETREILVGREYLTEHQLQRILRELDYLGYIRRSRGTVHLDVRTSLEFDEAAQREISEQARLLIL